MVTVFKIKLCGFDFCRASYYGAYTESVRTRWLTIFCYLATWVWVSLWFSYLRLVWWRCLAVLIILLLEYDTTVLTSSIHSNANNYSCSIIRQSEPPHATSSTSQSGEASTSTGHPLEPRPFSSQGPAGSITSNRNPENALQKAYEKAIRSKIEVMSDSP